MSKDTGRADFKRDQARLLAERQQKHALSAPEKPIQPVEPQKVTTDITQTDSEAE